MHGIGYHIAVIYFVVLTLIAHRNVVSATISSPEFEDSLINLDTCYTFNIHLDVFLSLKCSIFSLNGAFI